MSPAPTSELASSLQPKAGPSRASQVFFRPPTPTPDSASDDDTFYASGAKDKVLADLQAATRSTHNLTKTLNLWSHQGYCLDVDAANLLVTELLQAVYTVSEIGLVQHTLAAGSKTQSIALRALIESLRTQAPPAAAPSPPPRPSGSGPLPRSSNTTSDPASLCRLVKKALFVRSRKHLSGPTILDSSLKSPRPVDAVSLWKLCHTFFTNAHLMSRSQSPKNSCVICGCSNS
jgi:hypothetical protein